MFTGLMRNVFFVLFCFVSSCQANAKLANRSQDPCAICQLQKCKCEIALSRCCEGLIFGQFLGKLTWLYQKKPKKKTLELHNDWLMRDQVRGNFQFSHTVIFSPLILFSCTSRGCGRGVGPLCGLVGSSWTQQLLRVVVVVVVSPS